MKQSRESVHTLVVGRLRESKLLYTQGRRQLVDLLLDFARPVSVAEMLKRKSRLTQSSLYRNLTDLETEGVVRRVAGNDSIVRYELAEELIGHHHHLVCVKCGHVDDFVVSDATERAIDAALTQAARKSKFTAKGHRLDVLGLCVRCTTAR
ncbi:MAG: Fur family transcriptional regulator [Ilumatobacteraceae bacterium]